MGFYGDLDDLPLNDILHGLSSNGKTGLLTLTTSSDEITLAFDRGTISSVTSSDGDLRIGRLLVDQGYVTEGQIEQALALQAVDEDQTRIGDLLLEVGFVTEEEIRAAVGGQVEASIFHILVQRGGTFAFEPKEQIDSHYFTGVGHLEILILSAIRRADEWLDASGSTEEISLPDDLMIDPGLIDELTEDEHSTLIAIINGNSTMHSLARVTGLSARKFHDALNALAARNLVVLSGTSTSEASESQEIYSSRNS